MTFDEWWAINHASLAGDTPEATGAARATAEYLWKTAQAAKNAEVEKLLDAHDVGKLLSLSPQTIIKMAGAGRFPEPLLMGKDRRWTAAMVQGFIDQLKVERDTRIRERK